ncbi:MAG: YraN family protein [Alphaproteobacteria bacterium]|nr:YraN family protein [Alphaproteobacteria bacterium]MBV9858775.1 YraN family protein [Alphaproteobacteria bacterium]
MTRGARNAIDRRRRAERRGRVAERLCRWHLRLRGWRIVAQDWRCPSGEIDILARRGKVLAVIEVKSRGEFAGAATALSPRQRRRIVRAAEAFLLTRPELAALTLRFDVMLVAPRALPRHWPAAWRGDE